MQDRKEKLQNSSVYVRILPKMSIGGHVEEEDNVDDSIKVINKKKTAANLSSTENTKKLDSWGDDCIHLMGRHGIETYDFPTKVLGPDTSQNEVYKEMLSDLVDQFTVTNRSCDGTEKEKKAGYNVLFFAYGQTGTGKTHTILGPNSSFQQQTESITSENNKEWGVFPRVVQDVFRRMNAKCFSSTNTSKYILCASALEFYLGNCSDLLKEQEKNNNNNVLIGKDDFAPIGHTMLTLESIDDLIPFLINVKNKRTVRATKMNVKTDDCDGSSRSHCALILTLFQVNNGEYLKTSFSLIDFAGAERPDKTGEERKNGSEALLELYLGKDIVSTGAQGLIINYELFEIGKMALQASEFYNNKEKQRKSRKNGTASTAKKFSPAKQLMSSICQFTGSCMDGSALLGMVVTISQARRNGWETWFSMQYGTNLSKLKVVPCCPQKYMHLDRVMKNTKVQYMQAREMLRKTPKIGAPSSKYYFLRESHVKHLGNLMEILDKLAAS